MYGEMFLSNYFEINAFFRIHILKCDNNYNIFDIFRRKINLVFVLIIQLLLLLNIIIESLTLLFITLCFK